MRKETFLTKVVAGVGSAALAIALSACAHHDVAKDQGYGQIRTEAPVTADSKNPVVGTAPAPANAADVSGTTTPAVISGPAAVDKSGRAYTSSSSGGAGNDASLGTNTNVNLIPKKTGSDVIVTQSPATVDTTVVTNSPAPAPIIVETPAPAPVILQTPAPAPVIVETPAPAPIVVETPAPMSSSTTEQTSTTTDSTTTTTDTTTKHHRRMHKD
jgi:hypothetical protein